MKKQAGNRVKCTLGKPDGTPTDPTGAVAGEFVTETFAYDGGRQVTVYVPPHPPEAIVFAGDGQRISKWLMTQFCCRYWVTAISSTPVKSTIGPTYFRAARIASCTSMGSKRSST